MRDFTPEKVHGVVAQLVKVKDLGCATALEAAAGGRLYSVVVDTADTGACLHATQPSRFVAAEGEGGSGVGRRLMGELWAGGGERERPPNHP